MDGLASAVEALAGDDLHGLPAATQLERVLELLSIRHRLDAEIARSVRIAETGQASEHDGMASMASWLRGHARLSPTAAGQLVRVGRALEVLPAVAAEFAEGAIPIEQVAVIAPITRADRVAAAADQQVDLPEVERVLAGIAAARPYPELVRAVHHYLACLDPDGSEPDPTEGRSMTIAKHPDGSVTGRFELDAVGGEKVQTALEAFVQRDRPAGDTRTRAQQLGDAFVQWADVTLAAGRAPVLRTVKPHVFATVGIDDLVDPTTGPAAAETGLGALISAARARWLACDSTVSRVVMGPEGRVLDLGRSHRVVPPHLRHAVELRDRHCVFAGCGAPTHWCDVHHVREWLLHEGETSLENSALLCERHHAKVHHGFRVERQPDGSWHTYRPDGTETLPQAPLPTGPGLRPFAPRRRDSVLAGTR